MRQLLKAFTFLALSVASMPSQSVCGQTENATRAFDEGNQYFREGEYEQARSAYEHAIGEGFVSGALLYNLGNTYFRLDRLGLAMLYYQRARRFLPDDLELSHNIDLIKARSRDEFSVVPTPVWSRWWNSFVGAVGLDLLFWLAAVGWVAGLSLVGYRIFTDVRTDWTRRTATLLIVFGMGAGLAAVATSWSQAAQLEGVVVAERVDLLEEPNQASRITVALHEGLVIDVLESGDRWMKVRLPNGVSGFVEKDAVVIV